MRKANSVETGELLGKAGRRNLRVPHVPVEWYGGSSWRLPSGKALAEFALQSGFLAPLLLKTGTVPAETRDAAHCCKNLSRAGQWDKAGRA